MTKGFFAGKVVLLTGAAQGLGRQLALELAARDARLILIDNDEQALWAVRETLRTLGTNVHTQTVDVTDSLALKRMQDELPEGFTDVEILISNAGVAGMAFTDRISGKDAARIVNVNYVGLVNLVELFLPGMSTRRRGQIVGISSIAGKRGLPLGGYYAASKAAQTLFLDCLRTDLVGSGIAVSLIFPGLIDTAMNSEIKKVFRLPKMMASSIAARRILDAVARKKRKYVFPFTDALLSRLDALLPDFLRDHLLALPLFWQKGRVIRTKTEQERSQGRSGPPSQGSTSAKEKDKTSGAA